MGWDLWVDFNRVDADGLTHAHVRHAADAALIEVGRYIVVGDDDAEPAVAAVVSVDGDGVVLLRVLPGPASAHLELLGGDRPAAG